MSGLVESRVWISLGGNLTQPKGTEIVVYILPVASRHDMCLVHDANLWILLGVVPVPILAVGVPAGKGT